MRGSAERGRREMEMNGAETVEVFSLIYYEVLMKNTRCTRFNWVANKIENRLVCEPRLDNAGHDVV